MEWMIKEEWRLDPTGLYSPQSSSMSQHDVEVGAIFKMKDCNVGNPTPSPSISPPFDENQDNTGFRDSVIECLSKTGHEGSDLTGVQVRI